MKISANASPSGAYSMEKQPDKPGHVCIRFYENARELSAGDESNPDSKLWEYDEYTLVVPDRPSLATEIEENYGAWLETAKSLEPSVAYSSEGIQSDIFAILVDQEYRLTLLELGVMLDAG